MKINDKNEAFNYAWALYNWFSHNHEGQSCPKYAALSMAEHYNMTNIPEIHDNITCEDYEGAVFIYQDLSEDNWESYYNAFTNFMDNDWDNED